MMDPLLDKVRELFNLQELIRLIPQVSSMSWKNPISSRIALSIDHLFIRLRLPFSPIVHFGIYWHYTIQASLRMLLDTIILLSALEGI